VKGKGHEEQINQSMIATGKNKHSFNKERMNITENLKELNKADEKVKGKKGRR